MCSFGRNSNDYTERKTFTRCCGICSVLKRIWKSDVMNRSNHMLLVNLSYHSYSEQVVLILFFCSLDEMDLLWVCNTWFLLKSAWCFILFLFSSGIMLLTAATLFKAVMLKEKEKSPLQNGTNGFTWARAILIIYFCSLKEMDLVFNFGYATLGITSAFSVV